MRTFWTAASAFEWASAQTLSRPSRKLHMHWVRGRKMSPIAPTVRLPDVIPPIGKCFFEWFASGIVFCVPIDRDSVRVKRETLARGDLTEVETTSRLVQPSLMQPCANCVIAG